MWCRQMLWKMQTTPHFSEFVCMDSEEGNCSQVRATLVLCDWLHQIDVCLINYPPSFRLWVVMSQLAGPTIDLDKGYELVAAGTNAFVPVAQNPTCACNLWSQHTASSMHQVLCACLWWWTDNHCQYISQWRYSFDNAPRDESNIERKWVMLVHVRDNTVLTSWCLCIHT